MLLPRPKFTTTNQSDFEGRCGGSADLPWDRFAPPRRTSLMENILNRGKVILKVFGLKIKVIGHPNQCIAVSTPDIHDL
jgi:hypothetical protein